MWLQGAADVQYLLQAIEAHRGDVKLNDVDLQSLLHEARRGRVCAARFDSS